ncbi:ARM repeat superfamily protein [Prunus dulcis]|uniref:ARM repeat superfamily protein n=1 Tax=Prunus dulcis TaxID=3755 RepID=A0A4Y1R9G1_PRUDU|nr:ARM repeat superfamily protein [Prunus dulcis]
MWCVSALADFPSTARMLQPLPSSHPKLLLPLLHQNPQANRPFHAHHSLQHLPRRSIPKLLHHRKIVLRLGELDRFRHRHASRRARLAHPRLGCQVHLLRRRVSPALPSLQRFLRLQQRHLGELQRLATLPSPENAPTSEAEPEVPEEPCQGFLQRENFSTEIIESISPEDLLPTVKICVDGLQSPSIAIKQSAAAKLRLLAKNRADNRALIGESGAVPALIPLLRCSDPWTQEHAVTALLNLSLHESNKAIITNAGAIKSLVYVLKTGTETSKQNAACALLSLALIEENKSSIGACGAIPPLVSLLISGSTRGKKDALTTLYKLCSIKPNKERAVNAGAVKPLVALVAEQGTGLAEKAMVVLSSLAGVEEGKEAIVEEGGLAALVEAIEDGSVKGKEFAVLTLLQLCTESVRNRGLLVREGGIPPLVALSQTGTLRAKHKAETLLGYLREPRQEASSSAL